jgi:hypothetical protein
MRKRLCRHLTEESMDYSRTVFGERQANCQTHRTLGK